MSLGKFKTTTTSRLDIRPSTNEVKFSSWSWKLNRSTYRICTDLQSWSDFDWKIVCGVHRWSIIVDSGSIPNASGDFQDCTIPGFIVKNCDCHVLLCRFAKPCKSTRLSSVRRLSASTNILVDVLFAHPSFILPQRPHISHGHVRLVWHPQCYESYYDVRQMRTCHAASSMVISNVDSDMSLFFYSYLTYLL